MEDYNYEIEDEESERKETAHNFRLYGIAFVMALGIGLIRCLESDGNSVSYRDVNSDGIKDKVIIERTSQDLTKTVLYCKKVNGHLVYLTLGEFENLK